MLKRIYAFHHLPHQPLAENEQPALFFEASERFLKHDYEVFSNPLDLLETILEATESYIVLHERIITKGKTVFFRGTVVLAQKADIIAFVAHELLHNDLRPIRILAHQSPAFCLRLIDDYALLFEKN